MKIVSESVAHFEKSSLLNVRLSKNSGVYTGSIIFGNEKVNELIAKGLMWYDCEKASKTVFDKNVDKFNVAKFQTPKI